MAAKNHHFVADTMFVERFFLHPTPPKMDDVKRNILDIFNTNSVDLATFLKSFPSDSIVFVYLITIFFQNNILRRHFVIKFYYSFETGTKLVLLQLAATFFQAFVLIAYVLCGLKRNDLSISTYSQ